MASFSIFALLAALQAFLLVSGAPAPAPYSTPNNSTNITTQVDAAAASSWWFASITRQGTVPFGTAGYKVFRNVMDYGAKGDGSSDDTVSSHPIPWPGSLVRDLLILWHSLNTQPP